MKRMWAMITAVMIVFNFACMSVMAAGSFLIARDSGSNSPLVVNSDNKKLGDRFQVDDSVSPIYITTPEYCSFNSTYYFAMDDSNPTKSYLSDTKYFRTTITEKKNTSLLDGNPTVTSRVIDGTRYDVIRVRIKENGSKDEEEIAFTMNFKATSRTSPNGGWVEDDEFSVRFKLFASNDIDDSGNADLDAGDSVVFKPQKNGENTVTWGSSNYPIASLEFEGSSEADDFYAKLSTKANSTIYNDYGDAADAELFFRNFSGDSIDATSRGTLTLYNPWVDDDYNYSPDPLNIWIYRIDGNTLENVTGKFEYVSEDDTPEGVEGWQTRTRVLDAYVISDKELSLDDWEDDGWDDLPPVDELPDEPNDNTGGNTGGGNTGGGNGSNIPSTGSHDFVLVALIAGVASAAVLYAALRKKR